MLLKCSVCFQQAKEGMFLCFSKIYRDRTDFRLWARANLSLYITFLNFRACTHRAVGNINYFCAGLFPVQLVQSLGYANNLALEHIEIIVCRGLMLIYFTSWKKKTKRPTLYLFCLTQTLEQMNGSSSWHWKKDLKINGTPWAQDSVNKSCVLSLALTDLLGPRTWCVPRICSPIKHFCSLLLTALYMEGGIAAVWYDIYTQKDLWYSNKYSNAPNCWRLKKHHISRTNHENKRNRCYEFKSG